MHFHFLSKTSCPSPPLTGLLRPFNCFFFLIWYLVHVIWFLVNITWCVPQAMCTRIASRLMVAYAFEICSEGKRTKNDE